MSKSFGFLFGISLIGLSWCAYAGDVNCTNITNVSGDYLAQTSDCIIRVNNPFSYTSSVVTLPDSNEYTIEDNSDFATDECDNVGDEENPVYVCFPAGITVQSLYAPSVTVDDSNSTTLSGYYYQTTPARQSVKLNWDGVSNWTAVYDYWR